MGFLHTLSAPVDERILRPIRVGAAILLIVVVLVGIGVEAKSAYQTYRLAERESAYVEALVRQEYSLSPRARALDADWNGARWTTKLRLRGCSWVNGERCFLISYELPVMDGVAVKTISPQWVVTLFDNSSLDSRRDGAQLRDVRAVVRIREFNSEARLLFSRHARPTPANIPPPPPGFVIQQPLPQATEP